MKGPALLSWYQKTPLDLKDPLYETDEQVHAEARLQRRIRRGKAPPKKGEGKRAKKK